MIDSKLKRKKSTIAREQKNRDINNQGKQTEFDPNTEETKKKKKINSYPSFAPQIESRSSDPAREETSIRKTANNSEDQKRRERESNYHTYSAMIFSVVSVRLRLMRSDRRDMATEAEETEPKREREGEMVRERWREGF